MAAPHRYWEAQRRRTLTQTGTVEGLADADVCIGDRYAIRSAFFEVTQPRVTCFKVGIRLDEPRTPALLTGHRRPGFSLRGIEEGEVGASNEIMKIADVLSDSASSGCRRCCTRHHGPEALRRTLRVEVLSEPVRDGDRDRALGRMESFGPARSRQKPWPKPTRRARKARTARRVAGSTRGHVISQIGGRRHRRAHAGVVGEQERA